MVRFFLLILAICVLVLVISVGVPAAAVHYYGSPSRDLSVTQVFQYSLRLLWDDGQVTQPLNPKGQEQVFKIQQGEPIESFAARMQKAGIIRDAGALRDYLIYTGLDKSVQAGDYKMSPAMSIVDIAGLVQDATPTEVTVVVWPGWRTEEVAESLPTSGLNITPEDFLGAADAPHGGFDFLNGDGSVEGFLYPDSYVMPRSATVEELMDAMLRNFALHLTVDLKEGFDRQGLTVYQAVTLASIVQREMVHSEEAPMIASVYLNRLRSGMKLDADPTVQYAMGYNAIQRTWWTNPLTTLDLQTPSSYNTYVTDGLPPTPISNPGLDALRAVANPAASRYFYFSARCDGSGYHQFVETFEEQLKNLCP